MVLHVVKGLKGYKDIVCYQSIFCEGTLMLGNDIWEKLLQPVCYHLREYYYNTLHKLIGAKFKNQFRVFNFRNQSYECVV